MRRLLAAATCCLIVAAAGVNAESRTARALETAQSSAAWDWLRARLFGPAEPETPAQALARLGGTRLLLEADTDPLRAAILDELRVDVRRLMREARVPYRDLAARDGSIEVRLRDANDGPRAMAALDASTVHLNDMGDGLIRLTPSQRGLDERLDAWFDHNINVIMLRLKALGITMASAQREGIGGIVIVLPGIKDAAPLAEMLARRGQLELRLVDLSVAAADAVKSGPPEDSELLYGRDKTPYVVSRQARLTGRDIVEATPSFDSRANEAIVAFRFTPDAARIFARVTEDNVGRPFAIVLDGVVISAPVIREPIRGGSGQISGNFTAQQANDLALLLRSGALAFGMSVVEARAVAPAEK